MSEVTELGHNSQKSTKISGLIKTMSASDYEISILCVSEDITAYKKISQNDLCNMTKPCTENFSHAVQIPFKQMVNCGKIDY